MGSVDQLVWSVTTISSNSILMFLIDPWLIVFGLVPLLLGFVRKAENTVKHDYDVAQKPYNRKKKYVQRAFYLAEYAKELRLTEMYKELYKEWRENLDFYRSNLKKYGVKRAVLGFIHRIGIEVVVIMGATFYAVYNTIEAGRMLPGDCLVIINSIGSISYNLSRLANNVASFHEHALYLEDMRYFLEYEPTIKSAPDAPRAMGTDIKFENVTFGYKKNDNVTEVLKNISFSIHNGEKIALVGQNGSGKTTLVKLLLRLYDPTSGEIKLDEPSSALDPIAEYTMFENMMRATEGKTVIFISHRLSSATLADRVFLLEHGELTDIGTHTELMEKRGKYAEMFEKQAQSYLREEVG